MIYIQNWTLKKTFCYFIYRLIAKHLPTSDEFGVIGKFCHRLRSRLCRPLFREASDIIGIGKEVDFDNGSFIILRDHANIGSYSHITGPNALVTIGKHVMMGHRCVLINQNHNYLEEGYDGEIGKDILIDDYAWLGHNVIVLPGVTIGKHAIVGAGSVVTRDIPDYAIAVGNPAIVKKMRK